MLSCGCCHGLKPVDEFNSSSSNKYGKQCTCKLCESAMRKERSKTPRGHILCIIDSTKSSTNQRNEIRSKKRKHDTDDDTSDDELSEQENTDSNTQRAVIEEKSMFTKMEADEKVKWWFNFGRRQEHRCYISHTPLSLWETTIERLVEVNGGGYVEGNIAFINPDFQSCSTSREGEESCSQWTREKFLEAGELRRTTHNALEMDMVDAARASPRRKDEMRQRVNSMMNSCIRSTARRNKKNRGLCDSEITEDDIFEMWIEQKARCYYTNIPMNVNGKWKFSIERLDNDVGYTRANSVLVVAEVNHGNAHWSKEKAAQYWD